MIKRILGNTGEELSIIGFGGILVMNMEQSKANDLVSYAIDRGINYFDVSPSYGDAEIKLGNALVGKREKIFLACKTDGRTEESALKEMTESFKRLKTDYFDLYQLHEMKTEDDYNKAISHGGVLELLDKAKKDGKIRYTGFSAHSVDIALKLMDAFDFDAILFPVNFVNYFNGNFGPQVIEKAISKNIGRLAIKAMAFTTKSQNDTSHPKTWYTPVEDKEIAKLALRFTLSQPVTAAIPPGDESYFPLALEVAENFKEITEDEINHLKEIAKGVEPIFHA
ncbi:NADP-dependent oxidoreductase domain protein [Thermoanaerobacterium xylanolyticum LX-11]|uniref:NADP-dependent oxidoreductase domain protein n=1 Tax=Thermoanaerobacterium xylanolyticum (strain ATCC 49914 / DSM 7097 / LX-11) TaxID=858215 RepID=F6BJU4_THEXL|nr:aldo/keto reductase [Thermoanaerobacterium xylanolyticum]AEF17001.1 NADP-dependent oxidoreductase domain protein [Thermoanaerobacterium xylanolyticum LX-11]